MRLIAFLVLALLFAPRAHALKLDGQEIHPFFLSGDINLFLQAVNLTPAKKDGEITFAGNDAGFYVRSIRRWEVHHGVRSDVFFEFIKDLPFEVLSSVGFVPGYSNFAQFTGYARTESEVEEFRYRRVPYEAEKVALWREGDTATYEPRGGITMITGFGTYLGGLYIKVVVFGGFRVFIKRKAGDVVHVEIRSMKVDDVSGVLGGLAARVQKGVIREMSDGKAFEFRLSNPAARAAYEAFLQGHVAPSQELADRSDSGVRAHSIATGFKVNSYNSFYVGTPFIPIVAWEGVNQDFHHVEMRSDEQSTREFHWSAVASFKDGAFFGNKSRVAEGFSAQGAVHIDDTTTDFRSAGEAFFERRANYGDVSALNEVLAELHARTGLDFLKVRMRGNGKLDYTEVRLSVMFAEEFVQHLIAHPAELDAYEKRALQLVAEDYRSGKLANNAGEVVAQGEKKYVTDRWGNLVKTGYGEPVLAGHQGDSASYTDASPTLNGSNNIVMHQEAVREAFAEMKRLLPEVAKALREGKRKEFVERYAAFGREMWRDPRVFYALFEEAQKCGMSVDFEVSGRKISRYLKRFQWVKKDTCLR